MRSVTRSGFQSEGRGHDTEAHSKQLPERLCGTNDIIDGMKWKELTLKRITPYSA